MSVWVKERELEYKKREGERELLQNTKWSSQCSSLRGNVGLVLGDSVPRVLYYKLD